MEVLVGPAFTIGGDVSSPVSPSYTQQDKHQGMGAPSTCLFLKEEDSDESPILSGAESGIGLEDSSDSSSSIGAPDDSEDEVDDEENGVVSSKENNALGSLDSLEDALPIKRGLSNYFSGKSKSFTNLSEVNTVNTVKELEKPDNPFNKRRRILMANKWSRKSFYSWSNPKSMPLLTVHEEDDDDDDYDTDHKAGGGRQDQENKENPSEFKQEGEGPRGIIARTRLQDRTFNRIGFKSQSCFALSDLQEDDEEEYN